VVCHIGLAVELYQQEDMRPTRYQLVRRADVRDMVESYKVNEALDMTLRAFFNSSELQKKAYEISRSSIDDTFFCANLRCIPVQYIC